jgi:DNA-binding transcriptional LysR family regulator
MLNTWSLQVLLAVGERGSFSAAGEALSMTQPAVSRQIAGLERRLGVRLFSRVPRGVRPTPAGEIAIELARDSLARMHEIEARLSSFAKLESGRLRLSAFPSANTAFVPEAIRRFGAAHPGVTLSLLQAEQSAPLPPVRDGSIDLALVTDWHLFSDPLVKKQTPAVHSPALHRQPHRARSAPAHVGQRRQARTAPGEPHRVPIEGIELIPLLDEELMLALPVDHRLARQRRVRLTDLAGETWIDGAHPDCLGPIAPLADALGGEPTIGFWCDDWNGKQALVAAHAGIMLVPTLAHSSIRRDVVLRATVPSLPTRRLYAAAAASFRAPAVTAMLGVLTGLAAGSASVPSSG